MKFLVYFVIACASTLYFYRIIVNNDNDWSVIPKALRFVTIPFFVFIKNFIKT